MKIELQVDHDSIGRLEAALADREERAKHLQPALDEIADDFLSIERRRFAGGAQWKALSAAWAVQKAAGGKAPTPLTGGNLEQSLTRKNARFAIRRTAGNTITLGTSNPVAPFHRDGTGRLPRRPPVSVSHADEQRWVEILRRHLSGVTTGHGL